jgi:hypothetical protein
MFSVDQLLLHALGDYVLQSDYAATEKTKKSLAALVHVVLYTLPFLLLTASWQALLFIGGTHFVIDRWRLARYVCWAKNWLGVPKVDTRTLIMAGHPVTRSKIVWRALNRPWGECKATGYDPDKPLWMSVWLMIIVDNLGHIALNGVALRYLT